MPNQSKLFNNYKNKKVLITGGLGFIGSNLAERLVELDADVQILDSILPDYGGNLFNVKSIADKVKVNISDMRDQYGLNYLVKDQDIIFNLAGQVSHIDSMTDPYTDLAINCTSQLHLLEALRKNNPKAKLILASTRQIYGRAQYLPTDEKHPISPTDVNGINKNAGEQYHIIYHNIYQIPTVILRLTNTYGPKQLMKHNRQGFIPWFIRQIIEGKQINIFGDGQQVRDTNFVDDVVDAFLLAGIANKAIGQIYNLGSQPISLEDLTKLMIKIYGHGSYKLIPFPNEKKKIDIGNTYNDFVKITQELGWLPKTSLSQGLKKTFAYYQKNHKYYW